MQLVGFDNTTPWMNHHLLESVACFVNNYLDWIVILSSGYHYPPFEELGPEFFDQILSISNTSTIASTGQAS